MSTLWFMVPEHVRGAVVHVEPEGDRVIVYVDPDGWDGLTHSTAGFIKLYDSLAEFPSKLLVQKIMLLHK